MHTITLRVPFCAAHRILGHQGRCRHLHGHNYTATVTVTPTERTEVVTRKVGKGKKAGTVEEKVTHPPGLDKLGMVMDFADLKEAVKGWIDDHWDHNTILMAGDPLIRAIGDATDEEDTLAHDKEIYVMEGRNATAESMAEELCEQVTQLLLDQFVRVTSVTVEETDGCSATFTPDDRGGDGGDEDDEDGEGSGDDDEDLEDDEDEEEEDGGGKTTGKDKKAATHEEYEDDPELRGLSPR